MKFLPKKIIKLFLILFALCSLLFALPSPLKAAETIPIEQRLQSWYTSGTQEKHEELLYKPSEQEVSMERYEHKRFNDVIKEVILAILGPLTTEGQKMEVGAVPITTNLIASLINTPPVNTTEYLADLGSSLGLAKPVYAQQGTGFKALTPIMQIWKAFRNVSYMAFVIVFIALGFMIMFRTKINPQTVISIQEALPRIVVTLLLITFSYAIASLMIDLIYVVIYLAIAVFNTGGLFADSGQKALDRIFSLNIWAMIYQGRNIFIANPAEAVGKIVSAIGAGGVIVQGLTHAVLAVIIFMSLFKLFISLLTSYVSIILSVIFAPFSLLLNVFPGSNSFTAWARNLLANVAVFPVVTIMFLLAAILIGTGPGDENPWGINPEVGYSSSVEAEQGGWTPPFLVAFTPGIGYTSVGSLPSSDIVLALIGVGIILLIPHTVDLVKKMLKVEASPLSVILGAAPGAVIGAPGKAVMTGTQFLYQAHYARDTLKSVLGPLVGKFEEATERLGKEKAVSHPADTGGGRA